VIAAYPITPQSAIVEMLAGFCATGELRAKFINVESEHSAMAACISASVTGARTFTATSSQGLALMHEMLHYASGLRLPIVMANVNRALASPFNLKADLSDSLSQRDTGWLQFYCGSGQEVFDTIIQAFRISEETLLPVMVNLEGFILSHTFEAVDIADQDQVDRFLPPMDLPHKFDIDKPGFLVPVVSSELYQKYKHMAQSSMDSVKQVAAQVDQEFGKEFGRGYGIVESIMVEDAEIVIVTAGSIISTARVVIRALRKQGHKVGLLKIRLFRPFPREAVQQALRGKKKIDT
jgi:pyruvate/2-oxoacid:ferredoxin oxidoreductase alpha subunit